MCTIGAVRLKTGGIALFKNKDFAAATFSDRVLCTPALFGTEGLETFANGDLSQAVYSGLSVGANAQGLMACVSHVKTTDAQAQNYDCLVQRALTEASDIGGAIEAIQRAIEQCPAWWGNVILAHADGLAAVEVRDQTLRIEQAQQCIFRTNHQPLFSEQASPDGIHCSAARYRSIQKQLSTVQTLEALQRVLASHEDLQSGICNHGPELSTVYSYIFYQRHGKLQAHIAAGHPCQSNWSVLNVPFTQDWTPACAETLRQAYPMAQD